ncbi:cell division ATP-binding protein FtsE [Patescibacteria group bacterium]|nr:MAG: cell division ATP-binding protein FtsE [Patescibacteria group bacterium]
MIIFKNVTKVYDKKMVALNDVSFHIRPGEFVSLVGPSGAGKSTIIKMILTEDQPTKGKVIIGGIDLNTLKHYQVPHLRRKIGVVFQDFKLLPQKTIYENVAFAMEVNNQSQKEIEKTVPQLLELVGLEKKSDNLPQELSGGEKQRAAIARALAHQPKILLADEPTGNLDPVNAREIVRLLLKINKFGTTVVLATHNKDIVDAIRKRVIILDEGGIAADHTIGRYNLRMRGKKGRRRII